MKRLRSLVHLAVLYVLSLPVSHINILAKTDRGGCTNTLVPLQVDHYIFIVVHRATESCSLFMGFEWPHKDTVLTVTHEALAISVPKFYQNNNINTSV